VRRVLCHDARVTLDNVLWMLTALGAVVVLLTRMRLSAEHQAGHAQIPMSVLNAHTVMGVAALVVWVYYLNQDSPSDLLGLGTLTAWWIEAIIGVLILARWLPAAGKHAADAVDDNWAQGPSLSILGHVGMVLGVAFFTFCVVTSRIG
jgi:hypothetical protein